MLGLTCIPEKIYDFLYPFKVHFRCAQAHHFMLFCWLLMMLLVDPNKGTLKGLSRLMPERIKYWALMRMVRSGYWDEAALLRDIGSEVLWTLPPPEDGVLHLIGDSTLKGKRGKKHPLGHKARMNVHAHYCFGFEMVLLIASWAHYRVPVAICAMDPHRKRRQNIIFRRMLRKFVPPGWATAVVVEADAGFAANATIKLIERMQYGYVFAMPRSRKFTDGRRLKDLVNHLPKSYYRRWKTSKPDGRRRDYWVYEKSASLKNIGDVTIVLSKERRNYGPKKVKIIVTNLRQTSASQVLSYYARRWGIEVTIKELKGGLHLGKMQVTKEEERVQKSIALSVLAYLLALRLYGAEAGNSQEVSLFKLKQRFAADLFQEQAIHIEQKWKRKLDKYKLAA
jgi:hypothetical protein